MHALQESDGEKSAAASSGVDFAASVQRSWEWVTRDSRGTDRQSEDNDVPGHPTTRGSNAAITCCGRL